MLAVHFIESVEEAAAHSSDRRNGTWAGSELLTLDSLKQR